MRREDGVVLRGDGLVHHVRWSRRSQVVQTDMSFTSEDYDAWVLAREGFYMPTQCYDDVRAPMTRGAESEVDCLACIGRRSLDG